MRDRRGFTLTELLVVVVIMSLLIAVLFPVVARTTETSRRTVCATNLSALGKAIEAYVGGNRLPPAQLRSKFLGGPEDGHPTGQSDEMWSTFLVTRSYIQAPLHATRTDAIATSPFRCPSGIDELTDVWSTTSQTDPNGARGIADLSTRDNQTRYLYNWYGINARDHAANSEQRWPFTVLPQRGTTKANWEVLHLATSAAPPGNPVLLYDGQGLLDAQPETRINARHFERTQTNLLMLGGNVVTVQTSTLPQNYKPDWKYGDFTPSWRWE